MHSLDLPELVNWCRVICNDLYTYSQISQMTFNRSVVMTTMACTMTSDWSPTSASIIYGDIVLYQMYNTLKLYQLNLITHLKP